jgi:hypothetical protein
MAWTLGVAEIVPRELPAAEEGLLDTRRRRQEAVEHATRRGPRNLTQDVIRQCCGEDAAGEEKDEERRRSHCRDIRS